MVDITISGKVVEEGSGLAVPGVSVKIKGTSNAVVTDDQGNFKIVVPNAQATLVFSYLGFTTQEKLVGTILNYNNTLLFHRAQYHPLLTQ